VNPETIQDLFSKMIEDIQQVAEVDFNTRQIGRSRSVIVTPGKPTP
jgi:translation initiation factor IF-3